MYIMLNRVWVIRSDFPVVVIRSGFQNLSLSSFIIGLCMPDIGWLVCRFAVCRIFPALKTQAGKPRANEHALFPSTLQAACGNESTPVSEMATSQWSQANDAEWTLRCHHSSLCCRLRKLIPFQPGIFADVWRVTQERYYQVKKVCRTALINPALICLEQFGVSFSKQTLTIANDL